MRDQQRLLNPAPRAWPLQPYAPADPLPSMENGRTKSGILRPDADSGRKHSKKPSRNDVTPSGDNGATPMPATPYSGASTSPDDDAGASSGSPPAPNADGGGAPR